MLAAISKVDDMQREVLKTAHDVHNLVAPVEMPGLDSHLCFALYTASNHMTRLFRAFP